MIPGGWRTISTPITPPTYGVPSVTIDLTYANLYAKRLFAHFPAFATIAGRDVNYLDVHSWARFEVAPFYLAGVYLNVFIQPQYVAPAPLAPIQLDVSVRLPEWQEEILLTSDGDYIVVNGKWYIIARRRV